LWTNPFESDEPSNWARWTFRVSQSGRYALEVSSVAEYAVHSPVRYDAYTGSADMTVMIDPSDVTGFHALGEFEFSAGEDCWVAVYDDSATPLASEQRITVDAIQLRLVVPVGPDGGPSDGGPSDGGPSDARPSDAGNDGGSVPVAPSDGGCSCRIAQPRSAIAGAFWALAIAISVLRRRRAN